MVHLGYSVVITLKPVTEEQLGQSVRNSFIESRIFADLERVWQEHTWSEFITYHPIRPLVMEGTEKRTYYLTAVRPVGSSGVVRLERNSSSPSFKRPS